MSLFRLHAIFSSLQGEGRNVGRPATFIRFSSCNLACAWCDTHKSERMVLSERQIVGKVAAEGVKSVILTGGEPSIQPDLDVLVRALKEDGRWVALETNGVRAPACADLFDYVAVSPKGDYPSRYLDAMMLRKADEVRIVATSEDLQPFCEAMRARIQATDYYISPLEDKSGKIHYRRAVNLQTRLNRKSPELLPPWSLSIQMHKVLGIR
ncbi:MAG: 7-carboxy-7-deazaguanine synthase QueE [Kiritimatiellia bacterium]